MTAGSVVVEANQGQRASLLDLGLILDLGPLDQGHQDPQGHQDHQGHQDPQGHLEEQTMVGNCLQASAIN